MTKRLIISLSALIVVAALAGAAWYLRGPDKAFLPEFAATPWDGPDGTLYVARFEVTISEWNRCADDGACLLRIKPKPGDDPDLTPATGLNWLDTRQYVEWINKRSRHPLRLPTSAEWTGMAQAVLPEKPDPIFTDPELTWASDYLTEMDYPRALKPLGTFSVTEQGISDLDGPVWEWTSDCYDADLDDDRCAAFYAGGLHEAVISVFTRDPARGGCAVGAPPAHLGMRLVTDRKPPAPGS